MFCAADRVRELEARLAASEQRLQTLRAAARTIAQPPYGSYERLKALYDERCLGNASLAAELMEASARIRALEEERRVADGRAEAERRCLMLQIERSNALLRRMAVDGSLLDRMERTVADVERKFARIGSALTSLAERSSRAFLTFREDRLADELGAMTVKYARALARLKDARPFTAAVPRKTQSTPGRSGGSGSRPVG